MTDFGDTSQEVGAVRAKEHQAKTQSVHFRIRIRVWDLPATTSDGITNAISTHPALPQKCLTHEYKKGAQETCVKHMTFSSQQGNTVTCGNFICDWIAKGY
jgi:hypothetical protein